MCVFSCENRIYYNSFYVCSEDEFKSVFVEMSPQQMKYFSVLLSIFSTSLIISVTSALLLTMERMSIIDFVYIDYVVAGFFITISISLLPAAFYIGQRPKNFKSIPISQIDKPTSKSIYGKFSCGMFGWLITQIQTFLFSTDIINPSIIFGSAIMFILFLYMTYQYFIIKI